MKAIKFIFLYALSIVALACSSDDSRNKNNDSPVLTFDVNAVIARANNSDITNLVMLNGQNAAIYTSVIEVGNTIRLGRPEGLSASDQFFYEELFLYLDNNGELTEVYFDDMSGISNDGNLQINLSAENFKITAINTEDTTDTNYKYEMKVSLRIGGVNYGPYIIDPKIRIKSLN